MRAGLESQQHTETEEECTAEPESEPAAWCASTAGEVTGGTSDCEAGLHYILLWHVRCGMGSSRSRPYPPRTQRDREDEGYGSRIGPATDKSLTETGLCDERA